MKNLKNLSKRGIALALALIMCLSMLPTTAFAAGESSGFTCTEEVYNAWKVKWEPCGKPLTYNEGTATCQTAGSAGHWSCGKHNFFGTPTTVGAHMDDKVSTYNKTVPHSYSKFVRTTATCGAAGEATYQCEWCDATEKRNDPATGNHQFNVFVSSTATCGAAGKATYKCANCDATEERDAEATGEHQFNVFVSSTATCGTAGVATYKCANCDATEERDVEATGNHADKSWRLVDGKHVEYCGVCNQATGEEHDAPAGVCTGETTCPTCGLTVAADPSKHTGKMKYAVVNGKNAHAYYWTCCETPTMAKADTARYETHTFAPGKGNLAGMYMCTTCKTVCFHDSKTYTDEGGVCGWTCDYCPTTGHESTHGELIYTGPEWDSACPGQSVTRNWECSRCHAKGTFTNTGTGAHTPVKTKAVAATCTTAGNAEYWTCSACGKLFSDEACTTETTLEDVTLAIDPDNHTGKPSGNWVTISHAGDYTNKYHAQKYSCCKVYATEYEHVAELVKAYNETSHWDECAVEGCTYSTTKGVNKHNYKSYLNPNWDASYDAFGSVSLDWKCSGCDYKAHYTYTEDTGARPKVKVTRNTGAEGEQDYAYYMVTVTQPQRASISSPKFYTDHRLGAPTWTWSEGSDGVVTATAVFACTLCHGNKLWEIASEDNGRLTATPSTATCTEGGVITYTATVEVDGKTYTDTHEYEDPAKGHTPSTDWTREATGHYRACTKCGEKVDYAAHTASAEWTSVATSHWHECTECGYQLDAAAHTYGDWYLNIGANTVEHKCTQCGYVEAYDGSEGPHPAHTCDTLIDLAKIPATCTKTGLAYGKACSICGEIKEGREVLEMLPHTPTGKLSSDSTGHWDVCTVCGNQVEFEEHNASAEWTSVATSHWHECTECGYQLDADAHTPAGDWTVSETSHWHVCDVCGGENVKLNEGQHTYGSWYRNEDNEIEHKCTACDYTETYSGEEEFPEHDCDADVVLAEVPATCTSTGLTAGTACSICGALRSGRETIAMLAHAYGPWVVTVAPTYLATGLEAHTCAVCGGVETREIDRLTPPYDEGNGDYQDPDNGDEIEIDENDTPLAGMPIALAYEDGLTRGMLMQILYWHEGEPETGLSTFIDVPEDALYAMAIGWGEANGIAVGYDDGRFGPEEVVTRAEMEEILERYVRYLELTYSVNLDGDPDDDMIWGVAEPILNKFFIDITAQMG